MSPSEKLDAWEAVARALDVQAAETLAEAATRVINAGQGRVDVAQALLGDSWGRVAEAARLAAHPPLKLV